MESVRANATRLVLAMSALCLAVLAQSPTPATHQKVMPAIRSQLLHLPLAFEAKKGGSDSKDFISHGPAYTLRLSPGSATFGFTRTTVLPRRGDDVEQLSRTINQTRQFRMDFIGARPHARPFTTSPLKATSNYLVGEKAKWMTGVPMFGRVGYRDLYPGVDAAFYGSQGLVEYDLTVHPKADLSRVHLALHGADSVRLDQAGDLVATAAGGEFAFHKPVAYQLAGKTRKPVDAEYVKLADGSYGFKLGKHDRTRNVVIDPMVAFGTAPTTVPSLQYSAAWGDSGVFLAADSTGLYIARNDCGSKIVPTTAGALNTTAASTSILACQVQISKIDPNATSLIYSTYISGSSPNDNVGGVAVDGSGNVVVTGGTADPTFPQFSAAAPFTSSNSAEHAFMAKLNSTGTGLIYSTVWGGAGFDVPESLVLDHNGSAVTAGQSNSAAFPLVNSGRSPLPAAYRSTDGGATWAPSSNGLGSTDVRQFALDPNNPSTVYAIDTNSGHLAKSVDEGQNWTLLNIPGMGQPRSVAVDPNNSSVIYVGSFTTGLFKSTDGGATWSAKNSGLQLPQSYFQQFADNGLNVISIAVDPANSSNVYVGTFHGVYRSTDGGTSWTLATSDTTKFDYSFDDAIVFDVVVANGKVYATVGGNGNLLPGLFISADGGLTWTLSGFQRYNGREFVVTGNTIVIAHNSGVYLSIDGGVTFARKISGHFWGVRQKPGNTSLYYACGPNGPVATSADGGNTWSIITNNNPGGTIRDLMVFADGSVVTGASRFSAFVSRINSSGTLDLSQVDGGNGNNFNVEAAIDGSNNIYWAGLTSSSNVATSGSYSPVFNGGNAGFLGSINGSTGALNWLTYIQGATPSFTDIYGVASDQAGNAWIAGTTSSNSYPLVNPITGSLPGFQDGVISEFSPSGGLLFSTYYGGNDITGNYFNGQFNSIAVDSSNNVWAVGTLNAPGLPLQNPLQNFGGGNNNNSAMIVELSPSHSLKLSTYWGFGNNDSATQVISDPSGNIYIAGTMTGLPQTSNKTVSYFNYAGNNQNAWLIKLANSSLSVLPAVIAFPDQTVGTSSSPQPIMLFNSGTTTVGINSVITPQGFSAVDLCGGGVPPGGSCVINLTFRPLAGGRTGGSVVINSTAQTAPFQVLASGGGINAPNLLVFAGNGFLDFGNVSTGALSSQQFVRLYSNGTQPVNITSIGASSNFTTTNNCPAQLSPNSSCTVGVRFAPTLTGFMGGSLTISDNTLGNPHVVNLGGNGMPTPYLNVSPGQLTFPNQLVGTDSTWQTVNVTNPGTADALITPIVVGDYQLASNGCFTDVPPGGFCQMAVLFHPRQTGVLNGALFIFSNAKNGAQRVNLTGTGVPPPQIQSFFASPDPITAGQPTTLFASFTQATSGIISEYSFGTTFNINNGGSVTITPPLSETVTFSLTVSANGSSVYTTTDLIEYPPAVNNLVAAFDGASSVNLSWSATPVTNYYQVYRSTTPAGASSFVGTSFSTSFSDFPGATGSFYYTVVAVNSHGQSSLSNQASVNIPPLAVTGIVPSDAAINVGSFPTINVSFNHAPSNFATATSSTACTGQIQVSADNFVTCAPTNGSVKNQLVNGVWSYPLQLSQSLAGNTIYKVKVTGVTDNLNSTAPDFIQTTGFTTAPQMAVTGVTPTDGATGVAATTPIQVQFNLAPDPSTITVNTTSTCSGTVQVSLDNFATCVVMVSPPAITGSSVTVQPAAPLTSATQYQVRVTTGVRSTYQSIMPAQFTTVTGFKTL